MKVVTLMRDEDPMNPVEYGEWKVHSFGRRHISYTDPSTFLNPDGGPVDIGFRRKLATGTAFVLSYFEHGASRWDLAGEGSSCPWDSVKVAGVLVWTGDVKDMPKTLEERQKWARGFLTEYNAYCNGEVFGYSVEEKVTLPCGHTELQDRDSCFGFTDMAYMASEVAMLVKGDEVEFKGELGDYSKDYDFVGKKAA